MTNLKFCAIALLMLAIDLIPPAGFAQDDPAAPLDPQRATAQSLVQSGRIPEALALYDALTATGSTDLSLYAEARRASVMAHDLRRAAVYAERRLGVDPNDAETRRFIPLAYGVAGDEAQAVRARQDYVNWWLASNDPQIRARPLFMIDNFKVGPWTVSVLQCTAIAGDFGIGYMFEIWGPIAPPLPPAEMAANHRGLIVLEHNRLDQKIAAELGHTGAPIRPTLDGLFANAHVTLHWFNDEPSYTVLRDIVGQYVANDQNLSARPPMAGAWSKLSCAAPGT